MYACACCLIYRNSFKLHTYLKTLITQICFPIVWFWVLWICSYTIKTTFTYKNHNTTSVFREYTTMNASKMYNKANKLSAFSEHRTKTWLCLIASINCFSSNSLEFIKKETRVLAKKTLSKLLLVHF